MSDQTPESPDTPDTDVFTGPDHAAVKSQIETILDLDSILSSARRTERVVSICVDGTLTADYNATIDELRQLVDGDGNPINDDGGDADLNHVSRAVELQEKASAQLVRIRAATVHFRFRALSSDEWEEFDSSQRTGSDKHLRDPRKYENELIAKCAIAPALDAAGVLRLRQEFNNAQLLALFNAAFYVNNADGIDVPKSPSFLHAPSPQEHSLS